MQHAIWVMYLPWQSSSACKPRCPLLQLEPAASPPSFLSRTGGPVWWKSQPQTSPGKKITIRIYRFSSCSASVPNHWWSLMHNKPLHGHAVHWQHHCIKIFKLASDIAVQGTSMMLALNGQGRADRSPASSSSWSASWLSCSCVCTVKAANGKAWDRCRSKACWTIHAVQQARGPL